MADQRLEVLMKKAEAQYRDGSPILLEASALYLDKTTNNCIAQLKWKNIDPRPIKAVMIELDGYDAFIQKLEPIHYQYDGLLVAQGAEFGGKTPIMIKNNKVVKYDVLLKAVSFSDDTIWRAEKDVAFETLPESKPQKLVGEILNQLKRELSKQWNENAATYSPQQTMGLWQCGCGNWQYADSQCLKCKITQKTLEDISDKSTLAQHLVVYKEEQEKLRVEAEKKAEEARIAREKAEKERQEKEEAEKKRREEQARIAAEEAARQKARHKKIGSISTVAAIVLLVAGYFGVTNIQKTKKYNDALTLVRAGSYEEARTTIAELGDYKDCFTLLKKIDADEMWDSRQYAAAYDVYSTLPSEYQTHAGDYERSYKLADDAEKKGDYETASQIFGQLGKYKDSADRHDAAEISRKEALAESYKESGKYGEAYGVYLELGYQDDATECLYLLADALATSQPWLAYDGFIALGEYKDSPKRASDLYGIRFESIKDADTNNLRTYYDPKAGGYGLLDSNADVVVNPDYSFIALNGNKTYTAQSNERVGVFDSTGKTIIPFEYSGINVKGNNYHVEKNSLNGVIKPDGSVLIPVEYDSIAIRDDQYDVIKGGNKGILSSDGKVIVSPAYSTVETLEDGRFKVSNASGKYGILDTTGSELIQLQYDTITYENTNTYTVTKDGKYGIIKYDGAIVHEANMELIKAGSNDGKYLMFKENGMYGFMDANTFAVVVPAEWKEATIMTDGYAYIRNNLDKWGVIDSKGNVVVSPQWTYIQYYEDCGYALRSEDGSRSYYYYYLMDNHGKLVCDFEGDDGEYLGNGVFRGESGRILYSVATKTAYSYTVNDRYISQLRMLTTDLFSGYYRSGTSYSSDYCYGILSISQKKIITNQPWEDQIRSLPSRNKVNEKYGWIGTDGKDLISPSYDFMHAKLINNHIVAANYNDRGNLVYLLLDPSTGKPVASNLATAEEAYNYYGNPNRDMSTHGQIMWVLENAGFDKSTAEAFIKNCLNGLKSSARKNYESISASIEFKDAWSSIENGIGWSGYGTEEELLQKFIELALN